MSEDPQISAVRAQLGNLNVRLKRADAEFTEATNSGDNETAGQWAQEYADANSARINLLNEVQRQMAAEQQAAPRQLTREQVNAMNLEDMTPEIRKWWMSQQSKHGFDGNAYDAGEQFVRQNPVKR
jgi:hypothetical protein